MIRPGLPTGLNLDPGTYAVGIRVLVIEVSGFSASLLAETAGPGGLEIDLVRDAREAVVKVQNQFYEVIVIELPPLHLTSVELFRDLVAYDLEQAMRIVFLTKDLGDPATRKFLTEAGRPFLTQPVDPLELYDLVLRVGLPEEDAE
jgi:CheY-like chemotaxis protein